MISNSKYPWLKSWFSVVDSLTWRVFRKSVVVTETEGLLDTVDGARDATGLAMGGTVPHNKEFSHLEL